MKDTRHPRVSRTAAKAAIFMGVFLVFSSISSGESEARSRRRGSRSRQAKTLYVQAESRYSLGEYQQALDLYLRAFQIDPLPAFLFNVGQCYRNMKDYENAIVYYQKYLNRSPNARNRADVERLIRLSEEARQQEAAKDTPIESKVTSGGTGSSGARDSSLPGVERPPSPGTSSAPGARKVPGPVAEGSPSAGVATKDTTKNRALVLHDGPSHSKKRLSPGWFWTGVGLTTALLAGGIVTGAMAVSRNCDFKNPERPFAEQLDDRTSGQKLERASTAMFVSSGAVAIAAVILWTFTDFRSSQEPPAAVRIQDGLIFSTAGSF